MDDKMTELQNEALEAATEHIREQRKKNENMRIKIICLTVFACVVVLSASFLGCFAIYSQQKTIIEQQYALNMQYASLSDLLSGAEITTTTQSVEGDSATINNGSYEQYNDNAMNGGGE